MSQTTLLSGGALGDRSDEPADRKEKLVMTHQGGDPRSRTMPRPGRGDHVAPVTVLALTVVTLLSIPLGLANLALALLAITGPDCAEVSCQGDGATALGFLITAPIGLIASLAAWFAARPSRSEVRYALITVALAAPLLLDAFLFAQAPDWFW
ncbi:hypothetical protein [Actinomadura rubrisoli]|uniref:Uncharacterized protein n=1 Tax=Actinomadura rubrisoli TaxID=2530368 RepID=A0A4R5C4U7_9ACTN|nr:hypothetical protein [Actinomadura rubrisoli]TDD93456.1 hypothetical protein E1298_09570 [Actinomadura rubrisoli]